MSGHRLALGGLALHRFKPGILRAVGVAAGHVGLDLVHEEEQAHDHERPQDQDHHQLVLGQGKLDKLETEFLPGQSKDLVGKTVFTNTFK